MAKIDESYHKLLEKILAKGRRRKDPNRKGVYRIQIPDAKIVHDFKDGFPAITTKQLFWKGVVGELIWFLRGDTNIKYLVDNNINIWNKDAYNWYLETTDHPKEQQLKMSHFIDLVKTTGHKNAYSDSSYKFGDLDRVYGAQWRGFENVVDQISNLIKRLKENPLSSEHIVTAWNPAELDNMALPPCHWSFEILVEPLSKQERCNILKLQKPDIKRKYINTSYKNYGLCDKYNIPKYEFTLKWHQRSVDTFLGLPFNIASYALLAQIIGKVTNMVPKGIIGDLSNVHIYEPHLDAVTEQLSRDVNKYSKCELTVKDRPEYDRLFKDRCSLDNFLSNLEISDFNLKGYESYPRIPAEMLAYNK